MTDQDRKMGQDRKPGGRKAATSRRNLKRRSAGGRSATGSDAAAGRKGPFDRLIRDDTLHMPAALVLILVIGLGFGYAIGNAVVTAQEIRAATDRPQGHSRPEAWRPRGVDGADSSIDAVAAAASGTPSLRNWVIDRSATADTQHVISPLVDPRHSAAGVRMSDATLPEAVSVPDRIARTVVAPPRTSWRSANPASSTRPPLTPPPLTSSAPTSSSPTPSVPRPGRLPADVAVEPLSDAADSTPAFAATVDAPDVVAYPVPETDMAATGAAPWRVHAVPFSPSAGARLIALVIDDIGVDRSGSARAIRLPGLVTLALLPYAKRLQELADAGRRRGHELLVHMPMEPADSTVDPGPNALLTGMSAADLQRRLDWNLSQFTGFVGINNHMGSRYSASAPHMAQLMAELQRRGLLYLDSRTAPETVGLQAAWRYGLPAVERDVFLDNDRSIEAVFRQLRKVEKTAAETGVAVAIGHPYESTLTALEGWIPTLAKRGFMLAPISAVVQRPTEVAQSTR